MNIKTTIEIKNSDYYNSVQWITLNDLKEWLKDSRISARTKRVMLRELDEKKFYKELN